MYPRWLLLFMEFKFSLVYKPDKTHDIVHTLFRNKGAKPTTNTQLFPTKPDSVQPNIKCHLTRTFSNSMSQEACKQLAFKAISTNLSTPACIDLAPIKASAGFTLVATYSLYPRNSITATPEVILQKVLPHVQSSMQNIGSWCYSRTASIIACQVTNAKLATISSKQFIQNSSTTYPPNPSRRWILTSLALWRRLDIQEINTFWQHTKNRHILATDNATIGIEARSLEASTTHLIVMFLYESILTWLKCLLHLVNNQRSDFLNNTN